MPLPTTPAGREQQHDLESGSARELRPHAADGIVHADRKSAKRGPIRGVCAGVEQPSGCATGPDLFQVIGVRSRVLEGALSERCRAAEACAITSRASKTRVLVGVPGSPRAIRPRGVPYARLAASWRPRFEVATKPRAAPGPVGARPFACRASRSPYGRTSGPANGSSRTVLTAVIPCRWVAKRRRRLAEPHSRRRRKNGVKEIVEEIVDCVPSAPKDPADSTICSAYASLGSTRTMRRHDDRQYTTCCTLLAARR